MFSRVARRIRPARLPALALATAALIALPVLAHADQQAEANPQAPGQQSTASGTAMTVTAENLSDNPQNYYGKTVSVTQEVDGVLGPHVFTIEDGEFFGVSPDILVFAPDLEATPNEGSTVTVTGPVQKFTVADLERRYGWGWGAYPWGYGYGYGYGWYDPTLGPDYIARFENRPVVVANSVTTASGRQLVANPTNRQSTSASAGTPSEQAVGTSGRDSGGAAITNLSAVTGASAASHVNQRVHLSGLKVDRVASKQGFWVTGQSGQQVFVAMDRNLQKGELKAGDQVSIAGKIMRVPANKSDIDMTKWGLGDQELSRLMNDKVFIRANALQIGQQQAQKSNQP